MSQLNMEPVDPETIATPSAGTFTFFLDSTDGDKYKQMDENRVVSGFQGVPGIPGPPGGLTNGHIDKTKSVITFDNPTRTLSIAPVGADYEFFNQGNSFIKGALISKQIADIKGTWLFYFDGNGDFQTGQIPPDFEIHTFTAQVHWDGSEGIVIEDRHGIVMDHETHRSIHDLHGNYFVSGYGLSGYILDTDTDDALTIGIQGGQSRDQDLELTVIDNPIPSANFEQSLSEPAQIPVGYLNGLTFTRDPATNLPLKNTPAGRVNYNKLNGVWTQVEVGDNAYVAYYIITIPAYVNPIMSIQGQREDATLTLAKVNNTFDTVVITDLSEEVLPLYRLIFRTKNTFGGASKAKLVDVTDLRGTNIPGGTPAIHSNHNTLAGLQGGVPGEQYHLDVDEFDSVNGDGKTSNLDDADISFVGDGIKTKAMTVDTGFTFSNPKRDRVIYLQLSGNWVPTWPAQNKIINGSYDPSKTNHIYIHCVDTAPSYLMSIVQEV